MIPDGPRDDPRWMQSPQPGVRQTLVSMAMLEEVTQFEVPRWNRGVSRVLNCCPFPLMFLGRSEKRKQVITGIHFLEIVLELSIFHVPRMKRCKIELQSILLFQNYNDFGAVPKNIRFTNAKPRFISSGSSPTPSHPTRAWQMEFGNWVS